MKIKQTVFIDAAHKLKDTPDLKTKKCCNLHGHTYKITVEFESPINHKSGLSVDFSVVKDIINTLDHQYINDIWKKDIDWKTANPTTENIAIYYWSKCMYARPDIKGFKISVVEGYKGEQHSPIITYEG